jgi:membrane-associated protease RseP (regulator of RpoE activity)
MGASSSDTPEIRFPAEPWSPQEPVFVPPPPPRRERPTRYVILFLLTLVSTTYIGAEWYGSFLVGFSNTPLPIGIWDLLLRGFWYSGSVLAILGAHEFGHYYACRYYRVDASLPYFLPMPLLLTGTLGAFIRIRQPIPGKRALFDIGIAGPIAGFLVAVPVLFVGMYLSRVVPIPEDFEGVVFEMGEPLLFQAASWLTFGPLGDGYTVNMHPMAFAAWFGLLATALNLFPFGQLDGGHISYAVLGRSSTTVSIATIVGLVGLSFVSASWIAWTVLTLVMLLTLGARHPRTFDEDVPLDSTRLWLAAFAVLMFVLCFTPAPIEPLDLVTTR